MVERPMPESANHTQQSTSAQGLATENDVAPPSADPVGTPALGDATPEDLQQKLSEAGFRSRTSLILSVRDSKYRFTLDADTLDEIVIGRYDYHTGVAPAIDLADCGGVVQGVSRQHATIIRQHGSLYLVDKGGSNGTYLNGQRLLPGQPRILRDGDDVSLGRLVLQVTFVSSN